MEVLTNKLDKAARATRFGYHPSYKSIGLTHLSFADDLMVLLDGKVWSIEGITAVFDDFARLSGLKISMEKSTLYLAGITQLTAECSAARFPLFVVRLPVRYLGLPLVTKQLSIANTFPLTEQIQKRIGSSSGWLRFDSLATALTDSIRDVSFPLVWHRYEYSHSKSFLGNSFQTKGRGWTRITSSSSFGFWVWPKLLKYRDIAKSLCKVEVENGELTSFWYDDWSSVKCLIDVGGERGFIDMGIRRDSIVAKAWPHVVGGRIEWDI
ncbi:PREDICTED: uncharacterized protein LOC104709580 [Camelina sativa]|uniref:Uncharacterized protein LOC104709580 n=1 Tax=Camelina sativa TaxID=90675 RepID=A0ABM0TD05_CAMSA|nr:PREDICTED: uncharacterized protein LOC104709580 [Camelina sativa]